MFTKNFTQKIKAKKSLSSAPFQASSVVIVVLLSFIGAYWAYDEYTKYHENIEYIQARYLEESRKRLQDEVRSIKSLINYREQEVGKDIEKELRNHVHSAYTTASHLYSLYHSEFDEALLKSTIIEALRPIRWDMGKGYYFIGDMTNKSYPLHAARPDMENILIDSPGSLLANFRAFSQIAQKREAGFYRYLTQKPGTAEKSFPKLGFIKYFKPYDWFIGSGVYLDEMLARTQEDVLARIEDIRFGNNGYFFCIDHDGNTIADFDLLRKGRSVTQLVDKAGNSYGQQLFEIANSGIRNGFFSYELEDENGDNVLRLSHVVYYQPWDWAIVASVELLEMQKAIGFEVSRYKEIILRGAILYTILAIITIGIIFVIASYHSNRIREAIDVFTHFFRDTAENKISLKEHSFVFEEFDVLSQYANKMLEEREEKDKLILSNERRLDTLLELAKMSGEDSRQLADFALKRLCEITNSDYGYIGIYDEDNSEIKLLSTNESIDGGELAKPISITESTLPAKCYRTGKEIIDNYPSHNLNTGVYPEDLLLTRCLDVPCLDNTAITLVAGVCNKKDPYTEQDVRQISLLLEGVWRILLKTKAEQEMRDLRVMLRTVYDSMPSALIVVDTVYKVISWNNIANDYIGENGVPLRVNNQLLKSYPRLKMIPELIDKVIETNNPVEKRKVPYSHEGETKHETITVYPLQSEGLSGAVIRLDDVTDKVKIENLVAQSEKMLSVGGLAAGMAHEINNPLAGIVQNLQVVRNRLSSEFTKNHRVAEECNMTIDDLKKYIAKRGITDLLKAIEESSDRAAKLVKNMLSFSRKGNTLYGFEDVCDIAESALALALSDVELGKKINLENVIVTKEFAQNLPMVPCERTNMQQVFFNILSNGLYALAAKKDQSTKPEISIRVFQDSKWMFVEIEDNGSGMDAETVKRVFEPFYTTKPEDVGTGLGLSISYFIINEQHSGSLSVKSTLGKGTLFSIRLPLNRQKNNITE